MWGRCVLVVLATSRGSVVSGLGRGQDGVGDAVVRMGDGSRDELPALGLLLRRAVSLVVVVGGVVGGSGILQPTELLPTLSKWLIHWRPDIG